MIDDPQLLRRYAHDQSEEAFAELVRRHLGWIYRTALRRTGGRQDLAQDVAQYVFIALARQASSLANRDQLAGWFYTTIRNAAAQLVRAEGRRNFYESAAAMNAFEEASPPDWGQLRSVLDQEMDRLSAKDREAIILRFFEGKSFAAIGQQLHLGEDGARKRVERALDRLGAHFNRRGLGSSLAAVAGLLTAEGATTVSAQMQAAVTQLAVSGAAPTGATAALVQLMSATKTTVTGLVLASLAGIVALSTATVAVHEMLALRDERAELAAAYERNQAGQDTLRAAERRAAEAAAKVASLKAEVARKQAEKAKALAAAQAAGASAAAARNQKAKADTEKFYAQFPQARAELEQYFRIHSAAGDALFLRQPSVTPAQAQALITALTDYRTNEMMIHPGSFYASLGFPELPDDQLQAILGDQNFQLYKDTENTRAAVGWVGVLARGAAEGGVPLSLDQAAALSQVVASNSPEYASGGAVNPAHVNWTNVYTQAQQAVTPAQWAELQPTLQMQQVQLQIAAAAAAENATP